MRVRGVRVDDNVGGSAVCGGSDDRIDDNPRRYVQSGYIETWLLFNRGQRDEGQCIC